jgi:integrase/recombinase XerD
MATTTPSTVLVPIIPVFSPGERPALAGFLAAYSGLTRQAHELDLRQLASWCQQHQLRLFGARSPDIEFFARDLEAASGPGPPSPGVCAPLPGSTATPSRKNSSTTHPPHVRRPRLDYQSPAVALDRNELGALLVATGLGPPAEHALISLLALNGLRVSEATGADIEALGIERGHRTLVNYPQGRQGRDRPAGAPHGEGDRPGHRRAHRRTHLPGHRR